MVKSAGSHHVEADRRCQKSAQKSLNVPENFLLETELVHFSLLFVFKVFNLYYITAISQRVFKLWHSNFGVTVSVHAHFLYDDVNRSDGSAVYLTAKADKTSVPALAPFLTLRVSLSQSMM